MADAEDESDWEIEVVNDRRKEADKSDPPPEAPANETSEEEEDEDDSDLEIEVVEKLEGVEAVSMFHGTFGTLGQEKTGKGDKERAANLLQQELDEFDEHGRTKLMNAAASGELRRCEFLLQQGANIDLKDKNGGTALISAAVQGNVEVVDLLLKYGANPNARDKVGADSLIYAAAHNNVDVVRSLIRNKADVHHYDKTGVSAVLRAIMMDGVDGESRDPVINLLVEAGAKIPRKYKEKEEAKSDEEKDDGDTVDDLSMSKSRVSPFNRSFSRFQNLFNRHMSFVRKGEEIDDKFYSMLGTEEIDQVALKALSEEADAEDHLENLQGDDLKTQTRRQELISKYKGDLRNGMIFKAHVGTKKPSRRHIYVDDAIEIFVYGSSKKHCYPLTELQEVIPVRSTGTEPETGLILAFYERDNITLEAPSQSLRDYWCRRYTWVMQEKSKRQVSRPFNVIHKAHVNRDFEWEGESLEADFELVKKLGEGAFGEVYQVVHKPSGFTLAIKLVNCDAHDEESIIEIKREVEILKKCRNSNVVNFFGCYGPDRKNQLWIMMELCDGGSLNDLLERAEMDTSEMVLFSEAQMSYVAQECLKALTYLHKQKIFHRDIKSGNIMLTTSGDVKLTDFGISKVVDDGDKQAKNLPAGSPLWMAPEVITRGPITVKADIWSLGVTMIELAEGEPPHADQSALQAMTTIARSPPPRLQDETIWDPDFVDFVRQCCKKDPNERPDAVFLLMHPFIRRYAGTNTRDVLSVLFEHPEEEAQPEPERKEKKSRLGSVIGFFRNNSNTEEPAGPQLSAAELERQQRNMAWRQQLIKDRLASRKAEAQAHTQKKSSRSSKAGKKKKKKKKQKKKKNRKSDSRSSDDSEQQQAQPQQQLEPQQPQQLQPSPLQRPQTTPPPVIPEADEEESDSSSDGSQKKKKKKKSKKKKSKKKKKKKKSKSASPSPSPSPQMSGSAFDSFENKGVALRQFSNNSATDSLMVNRARLGKASPRDTKESLPESSAQSDVSLGFTSPEISGFKSAHDSFNMNAMRLEHQHNHPNPDNVLPEIDPRPSPSPTSSVDPRASPNLPSVDPRASPNLLSVDTTRDRQSSMNSNLSTQSPAPAPNQRPYIIHNDSFHIHERRLSESHTRPFAPELTVAPVSDSKTFEEFVSNLTLSEGDRTAFRNAVGDEIPSEHDLSIMNLPTLNLMGLRPLESARILKAIREEVIRREIASGKRSVESTAYKHVHPENSTDPFAARKSHDYSTDPLLDEGQPISHPVKPRNACRGCCGQDDQCTVM